MKQTIEQWRQKWTALPSSDQRALAILGLFLGVIIIVFGLFKPAQSYFEGARAEVEASRELVAWIEKQRPQLERVQRNTGGQSQAQGTLLQRVTAAAKNHKVTIKRFEPEGDGRIRLWVDEARYQDLQPWLNTLLQQRFVIRSISVDALAEEGMISARLTLER
ncbi:type II secretion system protein GspM [Microbulbifer agarilyticus]|uniref:type II secretion system protein GspM n=1 Tax=Microbulbifer agarilyticus TaxID=260552 RepID=UPI001C95CA5D|nr:type II secretion system protein M [Microbulbifer agarilyticus]MBY6189306.1 type II secretion system protein M [Microbulbifer agarilyticus]MCA0894758.1 type II secretion system protein M [Microbulbifer agarilyticus]